MPTDDLPAVLRHYADSAVAAYNPQMREAIRKAAEELELSWAETVKLREDKHQLLQWVAERFGYPHTRAVEIAAGLVARHEGETADD